MYTDQLLDKLAELKRTANEMRIEYSKLIDDAMPAEVRARIAELDAEFAPKIKAASDNAAEIETQIKADVLAAGETIRGKSLMAVWAKGRVSWDTPALDKYLKAHPELEILRKEGEPSVSIREIK